MTSSEDLTSGFYDDGVFVGYIEILRYTGERPWKFFPLGRPDFSLVHLVSCLVSCFSCSLAQSCCTLVSNLVFSLALFLVFIFIYIYIRRLFYDLYLYPVSLYSIVVAQPAIPIQKPLSKSLHRHDRTPGRWLSYLPAPRWSADYHPPPLVVSLGTETSSSGSPLSVLAEGRGSLR